MTTQPSLSLPSGILPTAIGEAADRGYDVLTRPDGKTITVGYTWSGSDDDIFLIQRYPDGRLDPAFGDNGVVLTALNESAPASTDQFLLDEGDDRAYRILPAADGKFVVAGLSVAATSGTSYSFMAQYHADGTLDTAFGENGIFRYEDPNEIGPWTVAESSDGGYFISYPSNSEIIKVAGDGTLDADWADDGVLSLDPAAPSNGFYALDDGGLGRVSVASGSTAYTYTLEHYTADGVLAASAFENGIATVPVTFPGQATATFFSATPGEVLRLGQQLVVFSNAQVFPDGGGSIENLLYIHKFNLDDGQLDTSFGNGGFVEIADQSGFRGDIVVGDDGSFFLLSNGGGSGTGVDFEVTKLNPDGSVATEFGDGGTATADIGGLNNYPWGLDLDADGNVYVAGNRYQPDDNNDVAIAKFTPEGVLDPAFNEGVAYAEGAAPVDVLPEVLLEAVDGHLAQATLTVTGGYDPQHESLALATDAATMGNINADFDADTGTLTLASANAEATLAEWQAALEAVTFATSANVLAVEGRAIAVQVDDGSETSDVTTANLTLVPVNDAPTIAVNDGPSVRVGSTVTLTDANLNEGDPDDDGDGLTYTLDALTTSGTLALGGNELAVGNTFTQQDVDAGRVAFEAGRQVGEVSFDITLADGGEDGAGTVSDSVTIEVLPRPPRPDPDPIQVTPPAPQPPTPSGLPTVSETITYTGNGAGTAQLVEDTGNANEVSATLPGGVSLINEGARTAVTPEQALVDLIASIDARQPANAGDQTGVAGEWLSRLDDGLLDVRTLVLSDSGTGSTSTPIQITGMAGDADTRNGRQEAFVIDTRSLPDGNQLQLDHIDFASVIGATTITGGGGDNVVIGDDADQFIVLGEGDDELHGGGGDDTIGSEGGDDRLFGDDGDDTLFGGAGVDLLHGGRDTDTVRYEGSRDDYVIAQEYGVVTVQSKADPEDSDTLVNIEMLSFADDELALSYDDLAWITGLYDQVLGRQADVDGVQYWAKQHAEGLGKSEMAMLFMTSAESGQSLDVQADGVDAVLDTLYGALLGREADAPGKAYWVDQLESGASLGDVVGGFMASEEVRTHDLDAAQWDFIA
ncbi:DUF4214 domain-containing protein [Vreelandella gomseomensis]|uniref:DUF4214 domain-containing protein n=1 Tax=Vreelandella gomseomensis TaxID=370766 RepID=A0ABU1GGH9_9GAMM|nr:DUF4214 domain-containing protein [Halomonas gomseomensis]MDR5876560.1 DUF4214 domain-containing protein [Halomonas gomseomensis]